MRALVVILLAMGLPACGGEPAPKEVTGVVVDIESEGLGQVRSFTLKDGDDTYSVHVDPDVDYDFPLGHLQEHRATSDPVTVRIEERDGRVVALSIEDA